MEEKGLNQYQLAKKAGVQQGHLSKILDGQFTLPTKPTRAKLNKVLDFVDADWFRAAGVLEGVENERHQGGVSQADRPAESTVARAVKIGYILDIPDPRLRSQFEEQRAVMTAHDFEEWLVGLYDLLERTGRLALSLARAG